MKKRMDKTWMGLLLALVLITAGTVVWAQNGYGPMMGGQGYGYQQQGQAGAMHNYANPNRSMGQGYSHQSNGRHRHQHRRYQANGYAMGWRQCPYAQQRNPMNQNRPNNR